MSFQRRHFDLIASTIFNLEIDADAKREVANAFARSLSNTNPNFNAERFLFESGVKKVDAKAMKNN